MADTRRILLTGGAGFIGSAAVRQLAGSGHHVVILDKLTYAGSLDSLHLVDGKPNVRFVRGDIGDQALLTEILVAEAIDAVLHLAAESHVDRSIDGPGIFVETNVVGTFRLLNTVLGYWQKLDESDRSRFRFHHVSTDEVFGDLPFDEGFFTESTPYAPSSPYSASKAASDHFVRAWHATYGLPVLLSNCSNNYGPYHFPEKLIPLTILNALEGKPLPVYGKGEHVRDWLHVDDHARALELILTRGRVGHSYNVGGKAERSNLQVVESICDLVDERSAPLDCGNRRSLITFVEDRPGHDRRYAIDSTKIETEMGWKPAYDFADGLAATVDWYLGNEWWWRPLRDRIYDGRRLGVRAD